MFYAFKRSFFNLIYPASCLHCGDPIEQPDVYVCDPCTHLLELLEPEGRCVQCFAAGDLVSATHCAPCAYRTFPLKAAAALAYLGPAATLVRQMKYGQKPYLAKGLAAFLAVQLVKLEWPLPDLIIPVPQSFSHWLDRGYNQSRLLAEQLSAVLNRPFTDVLRRQSGDYSQAGLSHEQRHLLNSNRFYLNDPDVLNDKTLLLVDDVMTTGATLRQCAEVLAQGAPRDIYAMTVCKA